jgi:Ca2+-transporting ATPase
LFSNPWLLLAVAGSIVLQFAVVYLPVMQGALHTVAIAWQDWFVILVVALPVFIVPECYKWWRVRRIENTGTRG